MGYCVYSLTCNYIVWCDMVKCWLAVVSIYSPSAAAGIDERGVILTIPTHTLTLLCTV